MFFSAIILERRENTAENNMKLLFCCFRSAVGLGLLASHFSASFHLLRAHLADNMARDCLEKRGMIFYMFFMGKCEGKRHKKLWSGSFGVTSASFSSFSFSRSLRRMKEEKKLCTAEKNENKRNEKQRLKGNGMKTRVGWKPRGSSDEAEWEFAPSLSYNSHFSIFSCC